VTAGEGGIAMTNREQAVGDGMAAARMAFLMTAAAQASRRAPDHRHDAPDQHDRRCKDAEQKHEPRKRR
jgi:hypothetical protein